MWEFSDSSGPSKDSDSIASGEVHSRKGEVLRSMAIENTEEALEIYVRC